MNKEEYLKSKFREIEINLDDRQVKQFLQYYEMLIEKNKVMNLTAITEYEEVVLKHFIDSVAIPKQYLTEGVKLIDIGTGAGFPGIPIKIVYPNCNITLLDSLNKRIKFLDEVIDKLQLINIATIHGRAEDYAHKEEHRENYDLCVSRAVAKLSSLSEYCLPFVKKRGFFIAYKAGDIKEELDASKKAITVLGGLLDRVIEFDLSGSIKRSFVIIRKQNQTNQKYPRSAGKPTKEPIESYDTR